jgi:hypothetical protein
MSSTKASTDEQKGSSGSQQTSSSSSSSSHDDSRRRSSTGGHEVTGAEKFVATGGSGGVPIRGGQGYEHLANH